MKYDNRKIDGPRRTLERGGCGNPSCRECYNADGSLRNGGRYNGQEPSRSMTMGPDEMRQREIERMAREMSRRSTDSYNPFASNPFTSGSDRYPPKPSTLRALEEAREPIKQFIFSSREAVTWDSVVGNTKAKDELRDAIEASTKQRELYEFYEMRAPKGVLLYGPPGCGKTMFGKAAAHAVAELYGTDTEMLLINGAEIESPILSIAGKKIAALFAYARAYFAHHKVPVILFIDEADALLRSRQRFPISTEVVAQFLAEMDGLKELGAFVILATNQPDDIDEALLRDGRCERKIKVERPSIEAAHKIIIDQFHNQPWAKIDDLNSVIDLMFSNDLLIRELTNPVSGAKHRFLLSHLISGAMVAGLLSRAKSLAFRRDRENGTQSGVSTQDMLDAVMLVYEENRGLNHDFALREFVEEVALPAEALKNLN